MGRRMLRPGALALCLLLSGMAALAQSPLRNFELERLELNPGAEGSLVVGTGELLQEGMFRISAVGHYSHKPLLLYWDDTKYEVIGGRTTMHVAAAYALTNWLQVGAQLPVVAVQTIGTLPEQGLLANPKSSGLGTPTLSLRLGLLTQDAQGGFDVAVEGDVGLPVGSMEGFAGDGGLRYMPRVMVGRHFGFIRAALDAGFLVRPGGRVSYVSSKPLDELGNEVRVGLALATTGRRLRGEFNVRGMIPLTNQPGSVELLPGVRYLLNPSMEVFALAGVGVGSAPGTPMFRVLAGGSFGDVTPRRGPGESSVKCDLGLSLSPEECPDRDDDGDGVRNLVDKCPAVLGDSQRDGCPRTDTDKDGIEDSLDACPTEFGPAARQGCPVRDQDNDGVGEEDDACPTEAGPADNRGCPLKDRDKDGIENDQDACPNEPGPAERQGCPEEDGDKDGVPNRVDSCVKEPGVDSNLGCPQQEMPLVAIAPRQLDLRGKVYFEASQARIQKRSFELLNWVAKIMREHPELIRVVVGAHTDDRGFAEQNRRLTQQRAESVVRYLMDKGVPAERLEARGYGSERPIDINTTSTGRENNRRVEFLIIRDGNTISEERRQ
ncbi:OmpA family protein [Archangium minus]|uniref:OmpA family protein n=1 Tax=Archangium minus TaxID=83450 RepID=A0ABY9WLT5_9BACT|nr:OmpA family protein [Archangium minus]